MIDHDEPATFTPDTEPYLGRTPLFALDGAIPSAMALHREIATYTREKPDQLSLLQHAACQLIPSGVNLVLTIREMVRQGYLFGAVVLVRSLVERAAIISYLERHPEAVEVWRSGWGYRERPSLRKMLKEMQPDMTKAEVDEVCDHLNHIVHGDPIGAEWNIVCLGSGTFGYSMGRATSDPELCDWVCDQAMSWLVVLTGRAASIFPGFAGELG